MTMAVSDLAPRATAPVESRWRRIVTEIPVAKSLPLIKRLRAVEPRSVWGMPPIVWHQAEGFLVRDPYGNQWIDLTSGIMTANAGHAHPKICAAIDRAVEQNLLFSYAFPTEARTKLLEKLTALSPIPDSKAIVFCSGTEATECAMMLMRRKGSRLSAARVGVLSFEGSYHGRTLAASLAGGRPQPTDWIKREQVCHYQIPYPFCPRCPWGRTSYEDCGRWCFDRCLQSLQERGIIAEQIAGLITESVAGWATWPLPTDFAGAMAGWARENEILLTFDEVQAGCGRTGRMFGFEHFGVVPDLITLGKGLTSSLPVSAVVGRRELLDQPSPGDMSSTHGGSPVCVAAAVANLEVITEEHLIEKSARTGAVVLTELKALERQFPDRVLSIHGKGLFISAHLKRPDDGRPDIELADAVAQEAVRRGVMMIVTGKGFLKVAPPLGIDIDAAIEAIGVLRECFADLVKD